MRRRGRGVRGDLRTGGFGGAVGSVVMEWEGVCAVAALFGVAMNFIRFGKWQGAIEAKVNVLERESAAAITKFDVVGKRLEENSRLLAELNAKLGLLLEEHYQHHG